MEVMMENVLAGTLYDPELQNYFEDWLLEAGLKIKFNVVTYYIENKKRPTIYKILKRLGFDVNDEINTLIVVTNRPGVLIGKYGRLIGKYKLIFTNKRYVRGIDDVKIVEVRDPYRISIGIRAKIREQNDRIENILNCGKPSIDEKMG
jgi:hypothetical protein